MANADLLSEKDRLQSILDAFYEKLECLPSEQRESLEQDLHKIKASVADLIQNAVGPVPPQGDFPASEAKFRELAESIRDGFYELGRDWRFTYVNHTAAANVGRTPAEMVGKNIWETFPGILGTVHEQYYRQVMDDRQPASYDMAGVLTDKWYSIRVYPSSNGITVYWIDITASKQAEEALRLREAELRQSERLLRENSEALRKSEEKFSKVFRSSPIALAISTLSEGRFVEVNDSYTRIYGYSREEIIGHNSIELGIISPEDRQEVIRLFRQGGGFRNFELKGRAKSGEIRNTLFSTEPIEIDGTVYMLSVILDITDRKQMEDSLRASEAHLRESEAQLRARANEIEALMDAAPAVIWISRDPECREMTGNRYSYDFLQISQGENVSMTGPDEDLAKQHYHMEKDGRIIPAEELPIQVAAAGGTPIRNYTADIVFDDGRIFNLLGNVNPLLDQDGKSYGAIGVFVDITPMRKLEAEQVEVKTKMEVQRRLMEVREKERQGIALDIHDGPIQTLSGTVFNLQFVKEAYQDPALRVELEQIALNVKNTIRELREIVNDLRPPSLIRFGIIKAMQIHAEDVQDRYPELHFELNLLDEGDRLPEDTRLTLFRVFQEGLNNAIHHAAAKKISVRCALNEADFFLELRDDGKGFIVPGDMPSGSNGGHFGIIGMRERVHTVGGDIYIFSEPGKGSTIVVKVPFQ